MLNLTDWVNEAVKSELKEKIYNFWSLVFLAKVNRGKKWTQDYKNNGCQNHFDLDLYFYFRRIKQLFSLRLMLLGCWSYLAWSLLFMIFILHCRVVCDSPLGTVIFLEVQVFISQSFSFLKWNVSPSSQLHSSQIYKFNQFLKVLNVSQMHKLIKGSLLIVLLFFCIS